MAECDLNSVLIDLTASALAAKLDYLSKNKEVNVLYTVGVHHATAPAIQKARGRAEFCSNDKVSAFLVNKLCLSHLGGILNVPETCFVFI